MWISIDADLPAHPKALDLSVRMRWTVPETVGRLTLLWLWCLRFAEDGDLREHRAHRLAAAMSVPSDDSEALLQALIETGWVDREPYLRLHGWWERQGVFLRARFRKSPERWMAVQQLYTNSTSPGHAEYVTGSRLQTQTNQDRAEKTRPQAVARLAGARRPRQLRLLESPLSDSEQEIVSAWNALGAPFPAVRGIPESRRAALTERLSEPFFLANWRDGLARMARSDFHRGGGTRKWVATVDWFLKPGSVERLSELSEPAAPTGRAAELRAAF